MGQNVSSPKDENNEKELYLHKILRQREHIPFNVESWYKILENETFYTEFLPISPSIAQAFVNYYQARYNSKTSLFNTEHCQLIQSIENQLKEQIFNSKSKTFSTDGCFIRLSSRSPKDGNCLNQHMLKELYYQELNRLKETYPNEFDSTIESQSNMEMIAFCSAQAHCLKVTNEQETLNLLLSSERVFVDLLDSLHCQKLDETYQWNNHLIIRQWNHQLDHSMEFRCFAVGQVDGVATV
ncbi:hypothetical protein I4U23_023113 [Adineta vaga]|nr:hypothetical protein I4U23_023113 [Adineta vaga]